MIDLATIFRAVRVRRWHVNPDLQHTNDTLDGHCARVARIILALRPDASADLLRAALTHDDGESVVGDMPAPIKPKLHPAFDRMEADARGDIWGPDPLLDWDEFALLKLADRLDAYQWARHHARHIMMQREWLDARQWILDAARDLDCYEQVAKWVGMG